MKFTVDTNVIVRIIVRDDPVQAAAAMGLLESADTIVVPNACVCELVWVLRSLYRFGRTDIITALRTLANIGNIVMDRPAFAAGLAVLEAGGDFADGLAAHEGAWLGGDTFVSFDKQAVALVAQQGMKTQLLTG